MARGLALMLLGLSASAGAENVTHSYDALGRLVASAYVNGPRNAKSATLTYDPAGNRMLYGYGASGSALAPGDADAQLAAAAARSGPSPNALNDESRTAGQGPTPDELHGAKPALGRADGAAAPHE
jgi:hypothetical protein